ncbi:hypothetical protein [Fuchsiella alkaliacetigena]|uniref:hypothetical protein n=1 Tax=Fuchsiella alkaliacetigena TaxID=957042 RepID=UPI002009E7E1|nr:hypothetical protein [Fuchsiella alkaliacetigena]MCK8823854.1 hypothetical protein [Fuchsiella alkaliacetigena]
MGEGELLAQIVNILDELKAVHQQIEDCKSQQFIEEKVKEVYCLATIYQREELGRISYNLYQDLTSKQVT